MPGNHEGNPYKVEGLTYFYDFLAKLEQQYAWGSVASVAEEIDFVRLVGPANSGLVQREDGVWLLRAPIGRGHFALVELEIDRNGVLQPVMGGFLRR